MEISNQIPLATNQNASTNAQLLRTSYTESHLMISGVPGHMEISNQNALVINWDFPLNDPGRLRTLEISIQTAAIIKWGL